VPTGKLLGPLAATVQSTTGQGEPCSRDSLAQLSRDQPRAMNRPQPGLRGRLACKLTLEASLIEMLGFGKLTALDGDKLGPTGTAQGLMAAELLSMHFLRRQLKGDHSLPHPLSQPATDTRPGRPSDLSVGASASRGERSSQLPAFGLSAFRPFGLRQQPSCLTPLSQPCSPTLAASRRRSVVGLSAV